MLTFLERVLKFEIEPLFFKFYFFFSINEAQA